ncbi:MAG: hypothetical protein WCF49_20750 [Xanthobacteraceae bacterium]
MSRFLDAQPVGIVAVAALPVPDNLVALFGEKAASNTLISRRLRFTVVLRVLAGKMSATELIEKMIAHRPGAHVVR